jgi:putative ABC transport system ATP-binding protein
LEKLLRIQNLKKEYQRGDSIVRALNGISFEINSGEFISIVGRSGSGKSTLLNLIGGLDTPTSGNIFINNENICEMKKSRMVEHRRKTVGMVFQSFNLIQSKTALENISLALMFAGFSRRQRKKKALDLLKSVGLENRIDHIPDELSGGEAQRVAIARALANEPHLLLADEPTGNLDSLTAEEILEILKDLNQKHKVTIIMVTHDQKSAMTYSHKVYRMLDGKITEMINDGQKA